jgi:hypothetical protein
MNDINEDMAVNNVSSGNIAGAGVGSQGEPGVKKFAGSRVFKVPTQFFLNARMMKRKYAKYEEYVGADEVGQQIREYGNANYGKPIIVQDEKTGAMMYLRYGKSI